MAVNTIKLAISLPKETYRQLERARKTRKVSRSSIYAEALNFWIKQQKKNRISEIYTEGYRRVPEKTEHYIAFEQVGAESFSGENW